MKKAFTILFMFFLFAGIFAQTNTEYQTQLSKAKEYEKNKQYINALFCYYEAINAEPTLKAEEAFDGYTKLLNEIKNGNPGYGEFDEFTIYDGWKALCIEYEQFWTKNCPYVFGLYLVDDSKILDMEKRTASYSFGKTRLETYFFTHITEAMEEGLKKTRTKSWKGIPNDWPFTSIYHEEKNSFLKNGVALFRVNSETYFAPMFTSYSSSFSDYGRRHGYTLFDIDIDFIDKNGKKIFSISKILYDTDEWENRTISVENLSQNVMKIIDAGEYDVKVTSIRLHYGNFISEGYQDAAFSNVPANHEKIKRLPQISYDVEKVDTTYGSAISFVEKMKNRKLSLNLVDGGTFPMGSSDHRVSMPVHDVTVSSFYIWKTEVTQALWKEVMGNNPSKYAYYGADNPPANPPVNNVSWYDAIVFCNRMSLMDGRIPVYSVNGNTNPDTWNYKPCKGNSISGTITMNMNVNGYRLPTEAEWEYAAKSGKMSRLCTVYTHVRPSGNVFEWCWDIYDSEYYSNSPASNPTGASVENGRRVVRGGGAYEGVHVYKRDLNTYRSYNDPSNSLIYKKNYMGIPSESAGIESIYGFRIVCRSNEMIEQARLEEERIEKERLEQERLEKERIEKERLEQERLEQERLEKERIELEKKREKTIRDLSSSFVYVEGGQFKMGSLNVGEDEKPVHKVTLSSFDMAKTEVTQEQWTAIMEDNPSSYNGNMRPVNNVSWYDAIVFCNKLSILDDKIPVYSVNGQTNPESWNYTPCHGNSLTGTVVMNINANGYRLPTEAEWEYAARGGKKTKGYKYSGSNKLKDVAWYSDNNGSQIHDVATKSPNELGLYDMSGNVWEWCWDWYGSYSNNAQTNPVGPSSGNYRVVRGGSWGDDSGSCRVARRGNYNLYRYYSIGFRLVRSAQ